MRGRHSRTQILVSKHNIVTWFKIQIIRLNIFLPIYPPISDSFPSSTTGNQCYSVPVYVYRGILSIKANAHKPFIFIFSFAQLTVCVLWQNIFQMTTYPYIRGPSFSFSFFNGSRLFYHMDVKLFILAVSLLINI